MSNMNFIMQEFDEKEHRDEKQYLIVMFILCFLGLVLIGCTAKTVITQPDGAEYTVVSQKDAVVHMKMSNSVSLTVDNRGEGGIMSDIIKMWSLKFITEEDTK